MADNDPAREAARVAHRTAPETGTAGAPHLSHDFPSPPPSLCGLVRVPSAQAVKRDVIKISKAPSDFKSRRRATVLVVVDARGIHSDSVSDLLLSDAFTCTKFTKTCGHLFLAKHHWQLLSSSRTRGLRLSTVNLSRNILYIEDVFGSLPNFCIHCYGSMPNCQQRFQYLIENFGALP